MSYTWLTCRYVGNLFRTNDKILEKFVSLTLKRERGSELFKYQTPAMISRRIHSGAMHMLTSKTQFSRSLEAKTIIKCAQLEARMTGVQWNMQRVCQYCQDSNNKQGIHTEIKQEHIIKNVLNKKREQLLESEQRLRKTGQIILKDIRETKEKMKERMEDVIERENIWTVPNVLCVGRIVASPFLGYLVMQGDFPLAIGVFAFAGLTDLLDGWIARNFKNQSSKLGSFLDPLSDKILVGVLFATLTVTGHISVALTALIIARDLLLVGAGFCIRYKSLPPPFTLSRYFDASLATAQLQPTFISKVNTAVQLLLLASVMAAPVWDLPSPEALQALSFITAATTIASALSYVFKRNTYHIMKKTKN